MLDLVSIAETRCFSNAIRLTTDPVALLTQALHQVAPRPSAALGFAEQEADGIGIPGVVLRTFGIASRYPRNLLLPEWSHLVSPLLDIGARPDVARVESRDRFGKVSLRGELMYSLSAEAE